MKEDNNLLVTKKESKYASSLKKLDIVPFEEGFLSTDNYLMLQNCMTKGFLGVDIDDKNSSYKDAFAVTTNPLMKFPCPRTLFQIQKYSKGSDNLIRYGEKINIICHNEIHDQPLYLFSTLITPQSFSRFSRNQEVLVNTEAGYSTAWVFEHPDPTLRFSMEGKIISVADPIIIRHCSTGRLLSSDLIDYYNDYGHEYEVCCNNCLTNNKYQTLYSEREGRLKIDTKIRLEKEQNIWFLIDQ